MLACADINAAAGADRQTAWRTQDGEPVEEISLEDAYWASDFFQAEYNDAPEQLLNQIAEENDIVLTAIGDCGSCCSCCIRDAVSLEDRGIPSAAIITTEFVNETRLTRKAIGMPDLRPIVIEHPVSSITDEEVNERVQIIKVQAQEVWLGQRADI